MNPVRIHHRFTEEAAVDLHEQGFVLLFLTLAPGLERAEARKLTRATLRGALQLHFECDSNAFSIETVPGHAPVVMVGCQRVHVSFSYESNGAFIAIDVHSPIGMDATSIINHGEWVNECVEVAKAYLSPGAAAHIAGLSGRERTTAFAQAWALHEARLKCAGLPLQEWTPAVGNQIAGIKAKTLSAGDDMVVAYAVRERPHQHFGVCEVSPPNQAIQSSACM